MTTQSAQSSSVITLTDAQKEDILAFHAENPSKTKAKPGEITSLPPKVSVYFVEGNIWLQNKESEKNAGGFGAVRMIQNMETNEIAMLKVYKPPKTGDLISGKKAERAMQSQTTHQTLRDLNRSSNRFVRTKTKENKDSEKYYVIMPYAKGITLDDVINGYLSFDKFPMAARFNLAINLVNAVKDFHHTNRLHGDLNPKNVIVKDKLGMVELIDFDSATLYDVKTGKAAPNTGTTIFSKGYAAPELSNHYTVQTDTYALGQMLHAVLAGNAYTNNKVLAAMSHPDPAKRPPLSDVLIALNEELSKVYDPNAKKPRFGVAKDPREIKDIETKIESKHHKLLGTKSTLPAGRQTVISPAKANVPARKWQVGQSVSPRNKPPSHKP